MGNVSIDMGNYTVEHEGLKPAHHYPFRFRRFFKAFICELIIFLFTLLGIILLQKFVFKNTVIIESASLTSAIIENPVKFSDEGWTFLYSDVLTSVYYESLGLPLMGIAFLLKDFTLPMPIYLYYVYLPMLYIPLAIIFMFFPIESVYQRLKSFITRKDNTAFIDKKYLELHPFSAAFRMGEQTSKRTWARILYFFIVAFVIDFLPVFILLNLIAGLIKLIIRPKYQLDKMNLIPAEYIKYSNEAIERHKDEEKEKRKKRMEKMQANKHSSVRQTNVSSSDNKDMQELASILGLSPRDTENVPNTASGSVPDIDLKSLEDIIKNK